MNTKISFTSYKDIPAQALSNEFIEATFITEQGAKLQSIKFMGKEYLLQNDAPVFVRSEYGSVFEDGDFSGFDDMFPTIAECRYPGGVWDGTLLPDHGEVWTLPFSCAQDGESLEFSVHGVRLPYVFSKTVTLCDCELSIDYHAKNCSPFPMHHIWAAHPLFVMEEGTRFEIPGAKEIINVYGGQKHLGDYGRAHPWPVSNDGRDLSRLSPEGKCSNKYYIWNELDVNESFVVYEGGVRLKVAAETPKVPYLGVWMDEMGHIRPTACIAPEPCTGAFDAVDLAVTFNKAALLPPGGELSWRLSISFSNDGACF